MALAQLRIMAHKLARIACLSTISVLIFALVIAFTPNARAHEIRAAIADVTVGADSLTMEIELTLETLVAGFDLRGLDDTDNAPQAERYDSFRAMAPGALKQALQDSWPELQKTFVLRAGDTVLIPELLAIEIPEPGDLELPRDSRITVTATLPDDDSMITLGWAAANGPLVIRQTGGAEDAYAALLEDGAASAPLPRTGYAAESAGTVFLRFIIQGFEHIIPKGLDHIVFVLGLFFFSMHMRPLLLQVTAFTLAHTVTLALAALGIVTIPGSIVEPLIAASIVVVAIENILQPKLGLWRIVVVFVFGLLHGLGFASVLGDLGGGQTNFLSRLIGFNIGVEIGQLTVISAAFLLVGLWFGRKPWYRNAIATPVSVAIAGIGAFWFVERVWG